jgi:dinuclear metal center YbgI/SA1388 family protein
MHLSEFHRIVDATFPPSAAMDGDAIGMQVASRRETARKVLVAMELTDDVLQEAAHEGCDVILSFHPLIYAPLKAVSYRDRVGRLTAELIRNDIALIVVHTSFDAFPQGTNMILAERLGLNVESFLADSALEGYGMGVVASTNEPLSFSDLLDRIGTLTNAPVRYVAPPSSDVQRIAIVAGSGMSYYNDALRSGADVFITADVKYHAFHAANGHMGLIDPGHYEMEQFVAEGIVNALSVSLDASVSVVTSNVTTNPVRYHSPLPTTTTNQPQDHV